MAILGRRGPCQLLHLRGHRVLEAGGILRADKLRPSWEDESATGGDMQFMSRDDIAFVMTMLGGLAALVALWRWLEQHRWARSLELLAAATGVALVLFVNRSEFVEVHEPFGHGEYRFVTGVGDVDGDDFPDVLVVATDGAEIIHLHPEEGGFIRRLGGEWDFHQVTGVGNIDGKGAPDVFVARDERGWVLHLDDDDPLSEPTDQPPDTDWSYDGITGVGNIANSPLPDVLVVNNDRETVRTDDDQDSLMYFSGKGIYEDQRTDLLGEWYHPTLIGVGQVISDSPPEVLAVDSETESSLLKFTASGAVATTLNCTWDYEFVTGLDVFTAKSSPRVLAVDQEGNGMIIHIEDSSCRKESL